MTDDLAPLHPAATGFKLFRALPDGSARDYTAIEFTRGWPGADQFRRQLRAFGYIRNSTTDTSGYGLLDVLDANDDIVQDYDVPTAGAFQYIKRKLKLGAVPEDPAGEPQPTPAQWAVMEEGAQRRNGLVTEAYGRGAPRRLPSLRRNGWVDDAGILTPAGRRMVVAWGYSTETGKLYVTNRCYRCKTAVALAECCSAHQKKLCHACYRLTHFVEVCVAGCRECADEGLPQRLREPATT